MREFATYFLVTFSAVFFLSDPLGLVPVFLAMRTGVNILSRIMGLILAAMGMQSVIHGLCAAFPLLRCANG